MTNNNLLDFPLLENDGLDSMSIVCSVYSRAKALSDAQAAAQAAVLKPLLKDVICQQVLPAVTYGLFSFHVKSHISRNRFNAYGRIMSRCMHPAFKNSPTDAGYKLTEVSFNFLNFVTKNDGLTDAHMDMMVYIKLLEILFDDQQLHMAIDVGRENRPPVPNTAVVESALNLKFKLPTFKAVPDLISWLGGNGFDLTPVQPFLSI